MPLRLRYYWSRMRDYHRRQRIFGDEHVSYSAPVYAEFLLLVFGNSWLIIEVLNNLSFFYLQKLYPAPL